MTDSEATVSQAVPRRCQDCGGEGIRVELLHWFHGSRISRPAEKYCEACLMQGRCPGCGGESLWDGEIDGFKACPACGHDVELVGILVVATRFNPLSRMRRLTSAIAPSGRLILRYLREDGLFIEFNTAGAWLRYRRSYWQGQALAEAANALIEAFDEEPDSRLSNWLPEKLFEDIRGSLDNKEKLQGAVMILMAAYQAMPYDCPLGRGLNSRHFETLKDALTAP
jgi:hypothetical protein